MIRNYWDASVRARRMISRKLSDGIKGMCSRCCTATNVTPTDCKIWPRKHSSKSGGRWISLMAGRHSGTGSVGSPFGWRWTTCVDRNGAETKLVFLIWVTRYWIGCGRNLRARNRPRPRVARSGPRRTFPGGALGAHAPGTRRAQREGNQCPDRIVGRRCAGAGLTGPGQIAESVGKNGTRSL